MFETEVHCNHLFCPCYYAHTARDIEEATPTIGAAIVCREEQLESCRILVWGPRGEQTVRRGFIRAAVEGAASRHLWEQRRGTLACQTLKCCRRNVQFIIVSLYHEVNCNSVSCEQKLCTETGLNCSGMLCCSMCI